MCKFMFNSVFGWRTLSTYLIIMIIITIVHNNILHIIGTVYSKHERILQKCQRTTCNIVIYNITSRLVILCADMC